MKPPLRGPQKIYKEGRVVKLYKDGVMIRDIAETLNVSESFVYDTIKKQMKNGNLKRMNNKPSKLKFPTWEKLGLENLSGDVHLDFGPGKKKR